MGTPTENTASSVPSVPHSSATVTPSTIPLSSVQPNPVTSTLHPNILSVSSSSSSTTATKSVPLLNSLSQASPVKFDGVTLGVSVAAVIKGHRLDGHIFGTKAIPAEYILDANVDIIPNLAFDD